MTSFLSTVSKAFSRAAVGAIRLYQWTFRPLLGPRCRFVPHCSDYAIEAYERHGLFAGSWLTTQRLGRCHPWCKGGLDPVPEKFGKSRAVGQHQPHNLSQTITSE